MKNVLPKLLDHLPIDVAISAVYFAVRIVRHQKNMLLENVQAESSLEEKNLGREIVSEISKNEGKLISDFTQSDINQYILELSSYIDKRNEKKHEESSRVKQNVLQTWRNESVHNYSFQKHERKFKPRVFISYQHDQELSLIVREFLLDLDIESISWDSMNESTSISFIEASSLTDLAIFILTKSTNKLRENQFFELGYLLGKLGSENVVIFVDELLSVPSDLSGLKSINLKSEDWQYELAMQIDLAGISFEKRKLKR